VTDWGTDDLTQFLDRVNSNQKVNHARFPKPVQVMTRVNDCFSLAGKNLRNPEPVISGVLFLRAQYAYKSAVGMALSGQIVEAFVMMRSCLEYSGYALVIFADPSLQEVFTNRHIDDASMKAQKEKFTIREVKNVIGAFDGKLLELFQIFYDRTIDFGGHPNPHAVFSAMKLEEEGSDHAIQTISLGTDATVLLHAMKSTAQVGLAALFIFQHIFKAKFEILGIRAELDALRNAGL
jgi:hypothetical protein